MNKKGFTLVEILAVISLLAVIIIIVGTKGFGAFDNAKKAISDENKKAIIEGAKILLVEINNCDTINEDSINNLLANAGTSCEYITDENNSVTNIEIEVNLKYLIENKYVEGTGIRDITDSPENYIITTKLDGTITLPE